MGIDSCVKSLQSFIGNRRGKMKFMLILATFLVLWDVSHACLNPCNGVTAATCTAPCFTCGLCSAKCCQSLFGRTEIDRFLLPCLSGREDDEVTSDLGPALNELDMQSFAVCNNDGEPGLTWDEVDLCVTTFGHFFKDVNIPTLEDFEHFDTNADGVLFYEEWLKALGNH